MCYWPEINIDEYKIAWKERRKQTNNLPAEIRFEAAPTCLVDFAVKLIALGSIKHCNWVLTRALYVRVATERRKLAENMST